MLLEICKLLIPHDISLPFSCELCKTNKLIYIEKISATFMNILLNNYTKILRTKSEENNKRKLAKFKYKYFILDDVSLLPYTISLYF